MARANRSTPEPAGAGWPGGELAPDLQRALEAEHRLAGGYHARDLHQWRVALRRLIAIADGLARREEPGAAAVLQPLKALRRRAGASRDIDVLLDDTLPDFLAEDPARRIPPALRAELETRRSRARRQTLAALREDGLDAQRQPLLAWLAEISLPPGPAAQALAAALLDDCLRRLHRRARHFRKDPRRLHRFRTAVKNLHYAISLSETLFPAEAADAWKTALAKLQQRLGRAHDCHGAGLYLAALPRPPSDAAFADAFGHWCDHQAARAARKAARRTRQLRELEPYWRP